MSEPRLPDPQPAGRWELFGIAFALVGLWVVGMVLLVFGIVAVSLLIVWLGLPLLLAFLATLRWYARLHRRLAGRVLGQPILDPYLPPLPGGLFVRLRVRLTDRAGWRDLAWLFEVLTIGFALQLTALVSFPFLPIGWWGSPLLLRLDASITRLLLSPQDERLRQRIEALETSRQDSVDHSAAELRRIERDLHDGAQAQLVALGMNLGLARELIDRDPVAAAGLIAEAQQSSSTALADLRSLVRGIHPPVLADRGLGGAVQAIALAHPRPVEADVVLDGRPPAPVESAVYFAVAELLTNSAKYAAAAHTWVWIRHEDGVLTAMVGDDGVGGAQATAEGGLAGVQRRLAAFDGTLSVASPLGGGTIVTVKVPCVLRVSSAA
ncbi:sensor domain-containing protein [Nakamurella sp.]|uniref:sensor histidine kinase n=1 Tax=Nakamurella sp. TaxID=1869182 RepID=UPI003B3B7541